jgi:Putative Flp pilus-assembly TadE/G-like
MKNLKDDSGQALIISALCMTCLFGFVALAADVGIMLREKRLVQTAADSAAIAGASDLNYGNATTSAQAAAGQNGFTTGGAMVTVNSPPLNGPHSGVSGYVEVIVSQVQPTLFMGFFGRSSLTVSARAVATNLATASNCMFLLGPSGPDINLTGAGGLSVPVCGIIANSDVSISGSGSVDSKSIGVAAPSPGYTDSGSGTFNPLPIAGIAPISDPLAFIPQPSVPSYPSCSAYSESGSSAVTVPPGCYSGLSLTGSGAVTLSPGNYEFNGPVIFGGSGAITLGSGMYIFNTGASISLSGAGGVTGSGVTFYVTSAAGPFSLSGSDSLTLTAPTSGTYDGILFFQQRGDANAFSLGGSGSMNMTGIFYMPSAPLNLSGAASETFAAAFVARQLNLSGSGSVTLNDYNLTNSSSPLTSVRLVE